VPTLDTGTPGAGAKFTVGGEPGAYVLWEEAIDEEATCWLGISAVIG